MTTLRERNHAETVDRIVTAAREIVVRDGTVSLRAVARELGMTAPALYRYAASYEDLIRIVALRIDGDVADQVRRAANEQPADDPAARLVAACIAFRNWALANRKEFGLVFTNVDVECAVESHHEESSGMEFFRLLLDLYLRKPFPLPAVSDLDPSLAALLEDPDAPVDMTALPEDARGLIWILQRGWARLYGTVTLEVFGHIDLRMVEQGHLFRAMLEDQAGPLGMTEDLPRLTPLIRDLMARGSIS